MNRFLIFFMTISATFLFGCTENKFEVNVDDINVDLTIKRLDKDLFVVNSSDSSVNIPNLEKTYGEFFEVYNRKILRIGGTNESAYALRLKDFQRYCSENHIQDSVWAKYPDLTALEQTLKTAFNHYKYYFPKKNIPEVITCVSAFNESIFTLENSIGIALDKFLGEKSSFYERLAIEKYLRRSMIPQVIPSETMRAWAKAEYPYESTADDLLDNMIYEGKIQYYINCMLPETADTLKWRYTAQQFGWATTHEGKVWNYLVENKKLFETDRIQIRQYVGEAPFTTPFTDVSAPRIGAFVGYRIVENYMNQTNASLPELLSEKDSKKILSLSKYNPK